MGYGTSTVAPEGAVLIPQKGGIYSPTSARIAVTPEIGNILCCPLDTDLRDLSGNHTFDYGTPAFSNFFGSHGSYDGGVMMNVLNDSAKNARIIADGAAAFQIPHSSPVTFGAFIYATTFNSVPQLMSSGTGTWTRNYGISRSSSAGWRFMGATITNMGDQRTLTPLLRWWHCCVVVQSGRTSSAAAAFYINGREVWTGNVDAHVVSTADNFALASGSNSTNSDWEGHMCNAFVTDTVLDPAAIKNLSDESFGHASPWTGP